MADNEKQVISTLKKEGRPLKSGEIAELAGIEKTAVDKVIKKLKADGTVDSPKRCYYSLK